MSQSMDWPNAGSTNRPAYLTRGRTEWTDPTGRIFGVADTERFEFYLEADPCALPSDIQAALDRCTEWGLEMLDEDECPSEITEHGWTRIWFTPVVPVDDSSIIEQVQRSGRKGFGTYALNLGALVASYPVITEVLNRSMEVAAS